MNDHHDQITSYAEAPVGLCVFNAKLRYTEINKWLADINGLPPHKHIGYTVAELFPDLAAVIEPQLRQVLETGEPILAGSAVAETPAQPNVKRQFEHDYVPVKADDDTTIGVKCAVREQVDAGKVRPLVAAVHFYECGKYSHSQSEVMTPSGADRFAETYNRANGQFVAVAVSVDMSANVPRNLDS